MNVVDATDRAGRADEAEPPALLTIILDTNPHAWALLDSSLSLSQAVVSLLVFINAHLAINHANRIAVLASHAERAVWLYPTPSSPADNPPAKGKTPAAPPDDANKYRPFAHIEHTLTTNLRALLATTTPDAISSSPATMIAGALTMALSYISKQTTLLGVSHPSSTQFNYSDPNSAGTTAGSNDLSAHPQPSNALLGLTARVLILSVSGDLATQYIPIMNAIFACQRLAIAIDILKLGGDTVFLQQAADATGGIYLALASPAARAGLLQYLMMGYLPDASARAHLYTPGGTAAGTGVDFRAACFCHRRVVDIGFVCSICLSIFCEPLLPAAAPPDDADPTRGTQDRLTALCLTCASRLALMNYGQKPAVVPPAKKKSLKKKKRLLDPNAPAHSPDTPGSRAETPMSV